MAYTGSDMADSTSFEDSEGISNFRPQDFKDSMVIGKGK